MYRRSIRQSWWYRKRGTISRGRRWPRDACRRLLAESLRCRRHPGCSPGLPRCNKRITSVRRLISPCRRTQNSRGETGDPIIAVVIVIVIVVIRIREQRFANRNRSRRPSHSPGPRVRIRHSTGGSGDGGLSPANLAGGFGWRQARRYRTSSSERPGSISASHRTGPTAADSELGLGGFDILQPERSQVPTPEPHLEPARTLTTEASRRGEGEGER